MAIRKFIFFNGTEGYSQEQASNDELSLGKVTLSGVSGVALDVNGADIANLGAPTGANSAARKAYVDSGLATEAAARAADVATVTTAITAEATARANADTTLQGNITAEANARISADAALQAEIDAEEVARAAAVTTLTTNLSAEATARIAADAALQAEIDAEETARANAITSVQSGLASEATTRANADTALQAEIDAEEAARIAADTTLTNNLSAEVAARIAADSQLAANYAAADSALSASLTSAYQAADAQLSAQMQSYAESLQAGFSVKSPVKAIATSNITLSGTQSVDGVSLTAGMRVLVAGQTAAEANGIYVVASGAWARATDADASSKVRDGMSVFVEQGTAYGDSTWVLITNNDITLNTTALTFVQFSGLGQITAGNGLSKSGNELSVNVGAGMQMLSDAVTLKAQSAYGLSVDGDGVRVDLDGGKGLEFSLSGDIAVKLEADAGMQFDGTNGGLELKLNGDTLSKSASGLKVEGLPIDFTINGISVGSNVTANNLGAVVGGTVTDVHRHEKLSLFVVNGDGVAIQNKAVYVDGVGSRGLASVRAAACGSASTSRVAGFVGSTTLGPTGEGDVCVTSGVMSTSATMTANQAYYLGKDGSAVPYSGDAQSPGTGDRVIRLGYGMGTNKLFVSIQDFGQKA